MLELTATPKDIAARNGAKPRPARHANLLVEVTGRELDRERMIKMPLNLDPRQGSDWKATINAALTTLNTIDADAGKLRADTGCYIMLIQVERTGKDQRDGQHIHAEDVKDWLLTSGFDEAEIAMPKVMRAHGAEVRELDCETDILSAIDWRGYDPSSIADRIPENAHAAESQLQRIRISGEDGEALRHESASASAETLVFDPAYATRMISDLVLNPFVGRELVGRFLAALRTRSFDDRKLGGLWSLVIEELRRGLDAERTARAEKLFKDHVAAGRIQFRLRLDGRNWRMPFEIETTEPEGARQIAGRTGQPLQLSLFAPVYESELNGNERDVAVYLDSDSALKWWHRNVARTQYGLQGWKRAKIYPDFIFAAQHGDRRSRITILETKSDQLDNLDTAYKRELLGVMTNHFAWDRHVPAGTLDLIQENGETVECALILMSEWKSKLPEFLATRS